MVAALFQIGSSNFGDGSTPSQRGDVEEFLRDVETAASKLEEWAADAGNRQLGAPRFRLARAKLRVVLAQCDYFLEALDAGFGLPTAVEQGARRELAALVDRLDELDDSFGWACDAADELRALAGEEACA